MEPMFTKVRTHIFELVYEYKTNTWTGSSHKQVDLEVWGCIEESFIFPEKTVVAYMKLSLAVNTSLKLTTHMMKMFRELTAIA